MIEGLDTRLVVPLLPLAVAARLKAERLSPQFSIEGEQVLMTTQYLAAVPTTLLRRPVMSLLSEQDRIKAALDMIFLGF